MRILQLQIADAAPRFCQPRRFAQAPKRLDCVPARHSALLHGVLSPVVSVARYAIVYVRESFSLVTSHTNVPSST